MWDQAEFARRVFYCYVVWCNKVQHARSDETTRLEDFGAAVAEIEGRPERYSASTAGAWMRPGGSVPEPSTVLAIAMAGDADPGWLMFHPHTKAPEPSGFAVLPISVWPGRRRRRRSKSARSDEGQPTPADNAQGLRLARTDRDAPPEER
jgi:hypothetical protein